MDIFEFYKTSGIDLEEHNGAKFYAVQPKDACALLDLLNQQHVIVHSIDVLYKNENGLYGYSTQSDQCISWDLDSANIPEEKRYEVVKQKIQDFDARSDHENLAFLFSDEQSYKAWKKNHAKF